MALIKPVSLNDSPFGIAFPEAYCRISAVEFNAKNQLVATVDWWATEAVYRSTQFKQFRTTRHVLEQFDQDTPLNIKTALYGWLKTLPEFQGAGDAV